jgi:hypothetical protein
VGKRRSLLAIPLTDGLGGVVELLLLRALPNHTLTRDGRDTVVFDLQLTCSFMSRSVPEPIRVWHPPGEPHLAPCTAAGERPAEGRAATTRPTLWWMNLPTVAWPPVVAVLCSLEHPAQGSGLAGGRMAETFRASDTVAHVDF